MNDAPHAVLTEQLEERLAGRRLVAAVFLTFEFDPGFFEQEILPVLLNSAVSHARGVRLVQLEDALRSCAGRVAVYYDANRLVQGEAGSSRLDVRRIPVRHKPGVFHPKNFFLLVERSEADEDGHREQALLVGAMSANLTRAGWWENVEAAHIEEIGEGESTLLKGGLNDLLRRLGSKTAEDQDHAAARTIREFLHGTEQRMIRFSEDRLLPQFHSGSEPFVEFLDRCAGDCIQGAYLEVISPFLDNASTSQPLRDLIEWFEPKEVRILLPRDRNGAAVCRKDLYDAISGMRGVQWGRLPADLLKHGKAEGAEERFVHAKLYRFFTQKPKREYCFVGSVNLTRPAHQRNGNWETGIILEIDCPCAPDFWLLPEHSRPTDFKHADETKPAASGGTPLMLRYYWDRGISQAYWEADDPSPSLQLKARGVPLGELPSLPPRKWTRLEETFSLALATSLKETSFVEVQGHGSKSGLLLVQEEGMSHKPSLLLQLSVADILRYWSMLTPAQRTAFLEAKTLELGSTQEGSELLARASLTLGQPTFFDRFAGFFHAFNCLERDVREQLQAGRQREADYRLFGRKYDSLGTLIERVLAGDSGTDDVERYVILLCARQLCNELKRDFSEYWRIHAIDARSLDEALGLIGNVRGRLVTKAPTEMATFLEWFDEWFLKRARQLEIKP